jgi:hypothetical protein
MKFGKTAMRYKKAFGYLSTAVQIIPKTFPKRYREYVHYCINEKWATIGITNGDGPTLTVRDLKPLDKDNPLGLFIYTMPDAIFIHQDLVKLYESDANKYEIGLQYLVLHELIHWARFHGGEPAKVVATPKRPLRGARPGEAGDEFEFYAYGRDMARVWGGGASKFDRPCPKCA